MNRERLKRRYSWRVTATVMHPTFTFKIGVNPRTNGLDFFGWASAVGLACGSGIFAEDGLCCDADKSGGLTPMYRGLEGWNAVKSFFDLDQVQAVRLFAEHSYEVTEGEAAARAVAARIRQVIVALDTAVQERQDR
jgi:hypothetical protein